jgi:hypothetical protein
MNFEHTEDRRMLADALSRPVTVSRNRSWAMTPPSGASLRNWAPLLPCFPSPKVALAVTVSMSQWCLSAWGGAWWSSLSWGR